MHKVVYFGTPEVSTYGLKALVEDERFEVAAVVTQPPKKVGRKQVVTKSPIQLMAEEVGIDVLTPNKAKDIMEDLEKIDADLHIVVAFGQILPKAMVDMPKHGTLNIHPSLLPLHRGAAPVPATILAGDAKTGVCIMLMDEKMDHGPILDVSEASVGGKTTAELLPELMQMGADRLPDVAAGWVAVEIELVEQDHDAATFCKMLSRDDARIDWSQGFELAERKVRAYDPWPGTWTEVETSKGWERVKILKAHLDTSRSETVAFETSDVTSIGQLVIDELQFAGKKPMDGTEFAKVQKGLHWNVR